MVPPLGRRRRPCRDARRQAHGVEPSAAPAKYGSDYEPDAEPSSPRAAQREKPVDEPLGSLVEKPTRVARRQRGEGAYGPFADGAVVDYEPDAGAGAFRAPVRRADVGITPPTPLRQVLRGEHEPR